MAAISLLNPKAEFARAAQALAVNISAAKGIQDVMKTNLGPKGTMKMLVSGAGDIKITKDGNVLLHEMQIQHPTASLIARASTAQDDATGDGTTSTVLLIGELLKQADIYISEGLHPRILTEGLDVARGKALEILDSMKIPVEIKRENLLDITRTSLKTKVHPNIAEVLTDACVDAVLAIRTPDKPVDLHMVEIIALKKKLCDGTDKNFVVINQKGIDPLSLDALAKEGIMGLRRAKRRNMERLALACGGTAMNSAEELSEEHLGYAGLVYEHILGEDKYTFVEQCKNPQSVTILIKGPNKHTLTQIKDAVRDGLRAINNAIEDKCVIPGAGAFEIRANTELLKFKDTVKGKTRLGIQAYAEALLVIPKILAINSGYDAQDTIVKLQEEARLSPEPVGLDLSTGEAIKPTDLGILDNYTVKKQILNSCSVIASNLLLVDEIMRAGMSSLKG
ncbi:Uncharacterized protein OBRU01_16133 [Operophtera brumata]|uniref:T-complex protein 1 subunit zeta n=1 Tax=Operophtera brumata TaxID=104452 RepID=A0A0L7L3A4_OPEBR|nr:Uncharacterized protein OBRU01_16133 [Operophtera brumata]